MNKQLVCYRTALGIGLACILQISIPSVYAQQVRDIQEVKADLTVPKMVKEKPAAGKRVAQTHPDYAKTDVYHSIYLPTDWEPGKQYPIIFEYAGNGPYRSQYGDECTGKVDDCSMGYGISRGKGFIWVCLPYLNANGRKNVISWWGDAPLHAPDSTVEYAKKIVPWVCKEFGGNPKQALLVGFSRGAIACNRIGLHDDEISQLWCGFIPYSHYDGVFQWQFVGSDPFSAMQRLKRLGNRPQFICHEFTVSPRSLMATRQYLTLAGMTRNMTFMDTGFRNHNDQWLLRPSPAREKLRVWVDDVIKRAGAVR